MKDEVELLLEPVLLQWINDSSAKVICLFISGLVQVSICFRGKKEKGENRKLNIAQRDRERGRECVRQSV